MARLNGTRAESNGTDANSAGSNGTSIGTSKSDFYAESDQGAVSAIRNEEISEEGDRHPWDCLCEECVPA